MKRAKTYKVVNKRAGSVIDDGLCWKSATRLAKATNAKNPGTAKVVRA